MSPAINQFSSLSPSSHFNNYTIILIYLSFTASFAQMIIILLLVLETPFRNRLLLQLGELKAGRAQLVLKSVAATVFVVMMYKIFSLLEICSGSIDAFSSPNQVILVYHMFQASLLGFLLILFVAIDGLHRYIKEVVMVQETIKAARKQNQAYEGCLKKNADEAEIIRKDISRLKTKIRNLESECSIMEQTVQLIRADSGALKSKLEGLLEEYDRLLMYNKDLKDQLQGVNERLSRSDGKRSTFFSWDRWGL